MRFASIASGSSGNSIYIGSDKTHILIDAGISNKRIEEGLRKLDIKASELSGICITHEHSDHIQGLRVLARKNYIPIYASGKTLDAIKQLPDMDRYPAELYHVINAENDISIGDISVHAFSIDHDAAEPLAYRLSCNGRSVAVATDMGHFTDEIIDNLKNLDAALIEANHDIHMLEVGPYPYYLKRRILSDFGHLSNENAGKLICSILNDNIKHILLGHLSKENNIPELAYQTVACEIDESKCPYKGDDFPIEVAPRDRLSQIINI